MGDGAEGLSLVEAQGTLVLALNNSSKVLTRACKQNCFVEASWHAAEIDTTDALSAAYDPYAFAKCGIARPAIAAWYYEGGAVAVRPDGSAAFAHASHILKTCAGATSIQYSPGFGRVVFVP